MKFESAEKCQKYRFEHLMSSAKPKAYWNEMYLNGAWNTVEIVHIYPKKTLSQMNLGAFVLSPCSCLSSKDLFKTLIEPIYDKYSLVRLPLHLYERRPGGVADFE